MPAIDGNGNQSIFELYDGRNTLTVTDVTLQHGYASVEAMYAGTASLIRCVVSNAPVVINQGGHINLTQSSLSGNIYYDNGHLAWCQRRHRHGQYDLEQSCWHRRSTTAAAVPSVFLFLPGGNVTVTNSTIAGNQVDGIQPSRPAIQVKGQHDRPQLRPPGIFASRGSGTATVTNTIIAGNFAGYRLHRAACPAIPI